MAATEAALNMVKNLHRWVGWWFRPGDLRVAIARVLKMHENIFRIQELERDGKERGRSSSLYILEKGYSNFNTLVPLCDFLMAGANKRIH